MGDSKKDNDPLVYINGRRFDLPTDRPEYTLLHFLRENGLTGTKLGCGEGGCGACTVMVSRWDASTGEARHAAVNACLCPLYAVEGAHVVTVEGLGSSRRGLDPVQAALARAHGSQCGFCTPGFVMSMYALLRSKGAQRPTASEVEEALSGNLCRCTGYRPILEAFRSFTLDDGPRGRDYAADCLRRLKGLSWDAEAGSGRERAAIGAAICPSSGLPCSCRARDGGPGEDGESGGGGKSGRRFLKGCCSSEGGERRTAVGAQASEPIFPPVLTRRPLRALSLEGRTSTWHRPLTLKGLLEIVAAHPEARIVGGNTEVGIETKFKNKIYAHLVDPRQVPELQGVRLIPPRGPDSPGSVTFGASASLTQVLEASRHLAATLPPRSRETVAALAAQLALFAGPPVRNVATLGGNVATASPISDLAPLWLALGAAFHLCSEAEGSRTLAARAFFLPQYRRTALGPGEVVLAVELPLSRAGQAVRAFKQARRREDDIAIVNAATSLLLERRSTGAGEVEWVVVDAALAFGGVAPYTLEAPRTAEALRGQVLGEALVPHALEALREDVCVAAGAPGGMSEYRNSLAASFLFKALVDAGQRAREWEADDKRTDGQEGGRINGQEGGRIDGQEDGRIDGQGENALSDGDARPDKDVEASMNGNLSASTDENPSSRLMNGKAPSIAAYPAPIFPESWASAAHAPSYPPSQGLQHHGTSSNLAVAGRPTQHAAAELQTCGEAAYTDDLPPPPRALHASLVLSSRPHARLTRVDAARARDMPGVAGVFFAADVPGSNAIGPVARDEELFASEEVHCVGQIVGVAVAETEAQARAAAREVEVEYEDLPAILSIAEARAADSFFHAWSSALSGGGDVEAALREADVVLEGELECGGQEHFYLEPNVSWVVPGEGGEVLSHSSTQCLEKHQKYIAEVLGLAMHRVTVRTKRLGGGFGGKETRAANLNAAAAVPAFLLQRPVRLCLDRDEDMLVTGQRHAFAMRYRLGCSRSGDLVALDAELFCNAGCSLDLSAAVMERALMHADGTYRLGAVRLRGRVCRTNQASHTAFRGFGAPQAQLFMEMLLERVAAETGMSALALRERNMYRPGDCQFFGQALDGCQARRCWDLALGSADYAALRVQVDAFNAANRFRKRGLAAIPTKFGISFTAKFLNQAGALVHVYTDGSCLLAHGGVEMGQGLHTKVAQVVAQRLGLPLDSVHVSDTATDKVPNASPTAASASSDMYGAAAVDACDQILARLRPYLEREREKLAEGKGGKGEGEGGTGEGEAGRPRAELPAAGWKAAVGAAYLDRVDLSAHGFYATPELGGFGSARPFNYVCYGAAACLVELDALTGDWRALRADVAMDVGQSLNPAIDVGQVEGAFVQGLGWACLEEVVWGDVAHPWVPRGQLYTRGPGTYKIPSVSDIPLDFRVSLLADAPCRQTPAVHSSKAVGEPPFFLGTSALFALRDAVAAARKDAGVAGWFELSLPATPEKLRMACLDPCSAPFAGPGFQARASV